MMPLEVSITLSIDRQSLLQRMMFVHGFEQGNVWIDKNIVDSS